MSSPAQPTPTGSDQRIIDETKASFMRKSVSQPVNLGVSVDAQPVLRNLQEEHNSLHNRTASQSKHSSMLSPIRPPSVTEPFDTQSVAVGQGGQELADPAADFVEDVDVDEDDDIDDDNVDEDDTMYMDSQMRRRMPSQGEIQHFRGLSSGSVVGLTSPTAAHSRVSSVASLAQAPVIQPQPSIRTSSSSVTNNLGEYIMLMFLQRFKEQAQRSIDEFAYKGNNNLINIVDYAGASSVAESSGISNYASTALQADMKQSSSTIGTISANSTVAAGISSQNLAFSHVPNVIAALLAAHGEAGEGGQSSTAMPPSEQVFENKAFEQLLNSFANVSKHNVNAIAEALCEWRANLDCKIPAHIRKEAEDSVKNVTKKTIQGKQLDAYLSLFIERKETAADYVFCCAMLLLLSSFHQPELAPNISEHIENMCFECFKKAPAASITAAEMPLVESRRKVVDLFSEIIGVLSIKRFQPIADRFAQEITLPTTTRQEAVSLIRSMKHLKLHLSRMDMLNRTTSFLKKIIEFFYKIKKSEIRIAIYESLANMISPLAAYDYKSGIDYREWFEILKSFHSHTQRICKKSKYYMSAYPFLSTILCVSSQPLFLDNFWNHMEALFKFWQSKDKMLRLMSLDCIIHVLGFYLKIVNENRHDTVRKTSFEKLSRTVHMLFHPGRKAPPSTANELVYDALVDIVVMISNNKLDFAMNHVIMEHLLRSENVLSENVLIGLRSFLAIADQGDVNKLSHILEEERQAVDRYPAWVIKLLERSHKVPTGTVNSTGADEPSGMPTSGVAEASMVGAASPASSSTANIRIVSPFSSSFRASNTMNNMSSMTLSTNTLTRIVGSGNISFLDSMGIVPYQEDLSRLLSSVLQQCDSNFGNLLLTNQSKPLQESLSKDKFAGLKVFGVALSCIPRLVPADYTPQSVMELLCRSIIHQHKEIRDVAWEVMHQIIDFQVELCPTLIHCYADMMLTIDDFKQLLTEGVLAKFIILLEKWIDTLHPSKAKLREKYKPPTVYGEYKTQPSATTLNVAHIESFGLILLCNLSSSVRYRALQIFPRVRTISHILSNGEHCDSTVADVLDETGMDIIERIVKKQNAGRLVAAQHQASLLQQSPAISGLSSPSSQSQPQISSIAQQQEVSAQSVEEFVREPGSIFAEFLRDLSRNISSFCPQTARVALKKFSNRARRLNERLININEKEIELWKYFVTFACSIYLRESPKLNTANALDKRKSREIESPKDLYDFILPHLKNLHEKELQAAVEALGCVHEDMLETLFEQLKPYEQEAFDKQKKSRKKKDHLRGQLSRIYARLSEQISDSLLQDREFIKEKFLTFVDEHRHYLSSISYNIIEIQPLRYNLYAIVENLAKKMHFFPPQKGRTFDDNLRQELFTMIIKWSGFGEANKQREQEENEFVKQHIEKLKDEEEKKRLENMYRRRNVNITLKACASIVALMLGNFFDQDLNKLLQWSATSRFQYKNSIDHPQQDDDGTASAAAKQKSAAERGMAFTLSRMQLLWNLNPLTGRQRDSVESTDLSSGSSSGEYESLGITFLKWIDEVLNSKERSYKSPGQQAIENMIETNPQLLPLCVDQCYHCNQVISQGYFAAIVEVFARADIECDVAMMLTLILNQSLSNVRETRNDALKLLQIISQSHFADNAPTSNYPLVFSSSMLDNYVQTHRVLAEKLAADHPEYTIGVLQHTYKQLEFVSSDDQRAMLNALVPWIVHVELDPEAEAGFSAQVLLPTQQPQQAAQPSTPQNSSQAAQQQQYSPRQHYAQQSRRSFTSGAVPKLLQNSGNQAKSTTLYVLDALFDVTATYGSVFSKQCEQLWRQLARRQGNISVVLSYLLQRCMGAVASPDQTKDLFTVCQHIVAYVGMQNAQHTLNVLCTELTNARDGVGPHRREKSPMDQPNVQALPLDASASITRADTVIILLVELAYKHAEDFQLHLPVILQYIFIRMDHKARLVSESTKLLLIHLVHSFVVNKLPHNGGSIEQREHLEMARQLIQFIHNSRNKPMWKRDRIMIEISSLRSPIVDKNYHATATSKNVQVLSVLVEKVVAVLRIEDLRQTWGAEALRWATKSFAIHNVVRSYQIYRVLSPTMKVNDVSHILYDIQRYMEDIVTRDEKNEKVKMAVLLEIIDTLRDLVHKMDPTRLILFPQLFWLSVALLRSDVIYIYIHALALLMEVIDHLDISNELVQNVIMASVPPGLTPAFSGVQRLIIRGLLNTHTEPIAIELLSKFTLLPCDFLFDDSKCRLLMNIMGLLPWLCLHIADDSLRDKTCLVASRLAQACDNSKLKKIAKVFLRYSKGHYDSQDKFLLELRKPFCEAFMPQHEQEIFDLLEQLLDCGPVEYHKPVLSILHSVLLHIDLSKSNLSRREHLINTIADFVNGTLWHEATRVLDVAVRGAFKGAKDKLKLKYKTDVQIFGGPKLTEPFLTPNIRQAMQDLNMILEDMRRHQGESSAESENDRLLQSLLASLIDGRASMGADSDPNSPVADGTTTAYEGGTYHSGEQSIRPGVSMADMDPDVSTTMVSALDVSELDTITDDVDSESLTEDFSEVTDDVMTFAAAGKVITGVTMEFVNDEEELLVKNFDQMLHSQLPYLHMNSPY